MDAQLARLVADKFQLNEFQMKRVGMMVETGGAPDIGIAAGYVKSSTLGEPAGRLSPDQIAQRHTRDLKRGTDMAEMLYKAHPDLAEAVASSIDNGPRMAL